MRDTAASHREAARLRSLGRLVADAEHELNNRLFVIVNLGPRVLASLPPGSKDHERMTSVVEASVRIKAIAAALAAFSHEPVTGHQSPVAPAAEAVRTAVELVGLVRPAAQITYAYDGSGSDATTVVPSGVIQQITVWLLYAARVALADRGCVRARVDADGDAVLLTVRAEAGRGADRPRLSDRTGEAVAATRSIALGSAEIAVREADDALVLAARFATGATPQALLAELRTHDS